ncbi:MAG TPA: long-chain fatty acid--CoA ligase [Solirubrobacteraceae bacterium]|jgi:long-subunit acyl-CoA synthetase (AMP-forming)|nr:long-chain fatty acid--CoA ligase [Solirubrobacteraceae bacterium]
MEERMESGTLRAAAGPAVDAPTLTEALRRTAANNPDIVAVRTPDDSVSLTWVELLERVDAVAGGLAKLGVHPGDTVAIMLGNRPEFHIADLAVVTTGATPFSIYVTYPAPEIEYLITDSGAKVAIVEQAYLPVMLEARKNLPGLEHVIVVDGEAPDGTTPLADVEGSNPDFDATAAAALVAPDDVLTLIYTSGTTGHPKGVQLSHHNIMFTARSAEEIIELDPGFRVVSWLPSAHIAERNAHHYMPIIFAGTVTCVPNPRDVLSYLPQVHPTWFFAVPRIWEKLKAGLEAMQAQRPEEEARPLREALEAAIERVRLRQRGEPVPDELEDKVARADEQFFSKLRAMLGLDQVVTVNVGAAPTPVDVVEFFHALGIELAELWGMSETCGLGTVNPPGAVKIGTVGPAAPGVEIKLADDGEVLMRSECVMLGYRNDPDKTAEAVDSDGWLHTGDIGQIDDGGYLRIVDRKKEIIINAAGKNMSPANIEGAMKSGSPLIGQAFCVGDRRSYNTALIVLDSDFAPQWAGQHGIEGATLEQLATEPEMIEAVQAGIDVANGHLARVEQIKKFTIVPGDWIPGGDELTPTMKLKRRPIAEKYAAEIEAMYA